MDELIFKQGSCLLNSVIMYICDHLHPVDVVRLCITMFAIQFGSIAVETTVFASMWDSAILVNC